MKPPQSLLRLIFTLAVFAGGFVSAHLSLAGSPMGPDGVRAPTKLKIDGVELFGLGFEKLSAFNYTIVDAGTGATPKEIAEAEKRNQVPDWVQFYGDKRVVLTGYLMPLQVENGLSKKFVMMKDVNTCCYGAVPNMNDYVVVTMKGEGVKAVQDIPVALIGVFHVAQKYENGYVTSLFQMDGEKFLGSKN